MKKHVLSVAFFLPLSCVIPLKKMKVLGSLLMFAVAALAFARGQANDPFDESNFHKKGYKNIPEDSIKTFKVSDPKNDKSELIRVFTAIENIENRKDNHKLPFRVIQRITNRKFIVSLGGVETYWLETIEDKNVADKEIIEVNFEETERIKEYTAVSGAKASVRIIVEVVEDNTKKFSKEMFISRLKSGEQWKLNNFTFVKCSNCNGTGKLSAMQRNASCQKCDGEGGKKYDLLVIW